MRQTLGDELLAAVLGISPSSLRRYGTGEREAPDDTAARLHWLAMVVSELAAGYNALGMRRWFERPRAVLSSGWQPDDPSARQVRARAAMLSGAQPLAV